MDKIERLKKIRETIEKDGFKIGSSRSSGEHVNVTRATEIIKERLKDGMSDRIIFDECGFTNSKNRYSHWIDKCKTFFEIAIVQNILKLETIGREYGTDNDGISVKSKIGKYLVRGETGNIIPISKDGIVVGIAIDISDLIKK